MPQVKANSLDIEVERYGDPSGEPILLIRGLGSQLIHWPTALIDGFVENGFHVVAYDNRDAGLSQKLGVTNVDSGAPTGRKSIGGAPAVAAYTLRAMAADGIGVLDTLEIESAHALGVSMGGMILQEMVIHFPDRIRTATIVMSSSGAPDLPSAAPEILELLGSEPKSSDRECVVTHWLRCDSAWASPRYPLDVTFRQKLHHAAYARCYCPDGVARQHAAMLAGTDRFVGLLGIRIPALVIHGTDDAIFTVEHGHDIAARIPGSELIEVRGMGHDLEGPVPQLIVKNVTRLAGRTQSAFA